MKRTVALAVAAATLVSCSAPAGSGARFTPQNASPFSSLHADAARVTGAYFVPSFGCVNVGGLAAGPGKKMWFTEFEGDAIGSVTTDGTVSVYPTGSGSQPNGIVARRKTVWSGGFGGTVFKSTAKGALTSFPIAGAHIGNLVVGPDKNVWFGDYGNDKVGRITKTGAITEFAMNPGSYPGSIVVGPDKNFWIAEARAFLKMSVSGAILKVYNGNKKLTKNETLDSIIAAPDGNLYFTESANDNQTPDKIGRITTKGKISEIATLPVSSYPDRMVVGKDGNVYFTIHEMQAVGEINLASGKVSYHWLAMTHGDTGAQSIAEGPDKRLWLGGCYTIYAVSY
ncbi:MAG TPA: hypothetical protein VGG89_09200 [Candidatus Baltobacteraceae bacterium]|jgi:virginiamycin B lyase